MEEYIITSITTLIFAIATAIMGYKGWWSKYKNLATTIYDALKDGKLTEDEINAIVEEFKNTKE